MAPAAAVMISIQISLVHRAYMEEGGTLARTLLPYINRVTDFTFLTQDTHFISGRFLNSLVIHVRDTKESIGVGFVLFALHLNPRLL